MASAATNCSMVSELELRYYTVDHLRYGYAHLYSVFFTSAIAPTVSHRPPSSHAPSAPVTSSATFLRFASDAWHDANHADSLGNADKLALCSPGQPKYLGSA